MNPRWRLRRATVDDLDAIMRLETSTFSNDAWSSASMRAELMNTNTYYLVAVGVDGADGTAIGGYAGLLAPHGAKEADIQTIAVAESARRNGIGRELVAALMDEAVSRGASEMFLEVRADNPAAQALYLSFGFEEIAVRPRYYQPDDVDAIVMRAVELRGSRSDPATLVASEPASEDSVELSASRSDAAEHPA